MEYKSSTPQTKAAGEGKATVVIATLGVKDRDGDVLLKGAFGTQVVSVVPAHDWKSPAIGKARIREEGNEAIADIDFYLTTDAGKNWYNAIKEDFDRPPARQQYSWGFHVPPGYSHRGKHQNEEVRFLHASETGDPLPIAEVSPVLMGAGHNTRSVMVKEHAADAWLSLEEKQEGVRIQSLIFPKDKWESAEAVRAWLRSHEFATELDATGSSWRARQEDPSKFTRLRTFCINPSRDASAEACRVQAVGGPMKESRGMSEREGPVVEPSVETPQVPLDTLPSVEDYKQYPEDRRPPLPVMTQWLRLYRYHMPFLQDVRKRDHKDVSPETISEFKAMVEEAIEVATQFGIKLLNADLMPTIEEEERRRQQHTARYHELSAAVKAQEELAYQQLQARAEELDRRARARSSRMKELFGG